jgi:hypothetical protein
MKDKPPKIRIWPDWEMRPGETNTEWLFRMLLQDLQTLASSAEDLIMAYPPTILASDQLANDFDDHLEFADRYIKEGLITQEMLDKIRAVQTLLDSMSDRHDSLLWTNEGVREREEWREIRRLAAMALKSMGYGLEPPPPAKYTIKFFFPPK